MNLNTDLGSEVITIRRAPEVTDTRDNSKYRDWTTATSTVVTGCMVQPFLMSNKLVVEDNLQREFASQFFRVWFPAGTDLDYADRLEWRGGVYDIYGEAGTWVDFEGNEDHVQCIALLRKG